MKLRNTFGDEDFLIEQIDGIPIVKINVMRATLNETKAFSQVLDSLHSANHNKIIVDFTESNFADSAILVL